MIKKSIIVLVFAVLLIYFFTAGPKILEPDTPTNAAYLLKHAIDNRDYSYFNSLFTEGRKNTISEENFLKLSKITTSGSSYAHYELITFENGEMLLVLLTPEKVDGKYQVQDIKVVPKEIRWFFKIDE